MSDKLREALQELGVDGNWSRHTGTPDTLVLELSQPMSDDACARFAARWKAATAGTHLEGSKVIILPEGVHLRPISEAERIRLVEMLLNAGDTVEWTQAIRETGESLEWKTFAPDGPPVATVRARSTGGYVFPPGSGFPEALDAAVREKREAQGTCTCPTMTLMQSGCQCGAMPKSS